MLASDYLNFFKNQRKFVAKNISMMNEKIFKNTFAWNFIFPEN